MKNINTFRKGDIILIGYKLDPIGWLIQSYTHSQFNHAAWIVSKTKILEAGRYGITIHPIKKYFNKLYFRYEVVRLKNITSKKLDKAIYSALLASKRGNYLKQILTFILLACKYEGILPRPTCSGLIAQSLYKVGFKFNNKLPSRITPEDIHRSKNVRKIK